MKLRLTLLLLAIISLLSIGAGGVFLTSHLTRTAWDVAYNHAEKTAEVLQQHIDFYLEKGGVSVEGLSSIPLLSRLSENGAVIPDAAVNQFLKRYCKTQQASLCYVMDQTGTVIATSNFDTKVSLQGKNYAFRPYFKQAIKGELSTYLALGVTTKKRGMYLSAPFILDAKIRGVVVIKYSVEAMEEYFKSLEGIFVLIDPNGIVFASNRKDWLYSSVRALEADSASSIEKSLQFGISQTPVVGLKQVDDGVLIDKKGISYLHGDKELKTIPGWKITYLFDTNHVETIFNRALTGAPVTLFFVVLFGFIMVVVIFLYRRAATEISRRRETELELRNSEEKYRLMFERSEDPMWVIYNGVFMMANQRAANILGYDTVDELVNTHPSKLSPDFQPDGESSFEKANRMISIAYQDGYHRFEWDHMRKSGEVFPVEVSLTRIPFENHDALYCVWRDISDTKRTQYALEKAREDAEKANKSKSEFLASMSHEIRTPMSGVIGFADMLLKDNIPEDSLEKVRYIKSSTNTLLRLINDILDMSKMEAGKLEIENISFNVVELVDDVVQIFEKARPAESNVELRKIIANNFPQAIQSDPTRIRQILVNLLGNAMKFTGQGYVTVRCQYLPEAVEGPTLRFEVEDSGIGMSRETQEKLFAQFTQADASVTRKYEGTGLGLAICKRLIELMDGEIGVMSEEDKGSTFWFEIPYHAAESKPVEQKKSVEVEYRAIRPLKLLLAEDNRVNQLIMQKLMAVYGHEVTTVENGAEAVESLKQNDYDLILMDVRMPEVSGPEATRMIRQLGNEKARIPIIAVTADAMKDDVTSFYEAGMNESVSKPVDLGELLNAMNKVMGETIHVQKDTNRDEQ